jgi:sporulation protein YlmC with PRC-barrel domain
MKKTTLLIASCGLASGLAMAAQEQDTETYGSDPEMTQDQSDYGTARPADPSETMGQEQMDQEQEQQTTEYGTEQTDPAYQAQDRQSTRHGSKDLSQVSASKLVGKTVTTSTGEEIGQIDEVWKSTNTGERVAVVEAGGFLGVGERVIAIPVSDLQQASSGDGYQTSMTRGSIENHPEFDESGYSREDGQTDEQGTMGQDEDTNY